MKPRVHESAADCRAPREIETDVLRGLCSGEWSGAEMRAALERLAEYDWQDTEHRVVYEAVVRCGAKTVQGVRAELPAVATRMGFPDVDWKLYLSGATHRERSLEGLKSDIEKLLKNKGAREE